MKTRTHQPERQSATTAGHNGLGTFPVSACQPIPPGTTLKDTIAHAKRLAAASRAIAANRHDQAKKEWEEVNHAGDMKRVQLLQAWADLSQAEQIDALTAANTVPDLLFHDAQAGDEAAAVRLVNLARHATALVSRLAREGNHVAIAGLVDLAESLTRNLNFAAREHPDRFAAFAYFRLEWPVMGSIRAKPDKEVNQLLKKLGLASAWTGINRTGKRWKLGPAHRVVLDLVLAVYQARPILSDRHFPDIKGLAHKLQNRADEPAKFVWDRLSSFTQNAIAGFLKHEVDADGLLMFLVGDLRELITGPPIEFSEKNFIYRARKLGKVVPHDHRGFYLPGRNWLNLAEAFPGQLLPPEKGKLAQLGEATLQHLNQDHDEHWWTAIEYLFDLAHPEPETEPHLRSLVTAKSHQAQLRSRIKQKLKAAFEQMIGSRATDPRSTWK